jgi:hypothetical protein
MKLIAIATACTALLFSSAAFAETCIFGGNLWELKENPRFEVTEDVVKTFKLSRHDGDDKRLLYVAVDVVKDTKTGRVYQVNRTFMDKYDGGNTYGWVGSSRRSAIRTSGPATSPSDLMPRLRRVMRTRRGLGALTIRQSHPAI